MRYLYLRELLLAPGHLNAQLHQHEKNIKHQLSEIGQIALTVSDVSVALPFYRDVFGLNFLFSPSSTLAFLCAGSHFSHVTM